MAVDCSELSKTLTDLAMALGSRPDVQTLNDVSREMAKIVPGVERQSIIDAIVESTGKQNKQVDDLLKKLNAIKTEARTDKRLQNKITQLETLLRTSGLPDSPKRRKQGTKAIERLRAVRDDLKKKISKSEPVVKKRLQAQIENLNRKIETGDILPTPRVVLPQSKQVERLQFERDELQSEIRRRINDLKPQTIWENIAEPFNTSRALITSWDASAPFRQGGFFVVARPIKSSKAFAAMAKAMKSKQGQAKVENEMKEHPLFPLAKRAKLFIAPSDGSYQLSKLEERFQTKWAKRIPGIATSERGYITFLNKQRFDMFVTFIETLSRNQEATLEEAKGTANFVNIATGRGNIGNMEQGAVFLNTVFFAPRYVASRFQLLLGVPFFQAKSFRVKKLIAKEYARYIIGMGLIYAAFDFLGEIFGAEIDFEWNPQSSDFGKIRIGKTRLDPLSGLSQVTVILARLITGKTKSTITGKVTPLRGEDVPFKGDTAFDKITQFLRFKLSPMFATGINLLEQEDAIGEPFTLKDVPGNLAVPISFREINDTIKEQNIPTATAISLLTLFGMGVSTYGFQEKKGKGIKFQFGK